MKAAFYGANGGPEVLHYGDVSEPELAPDSVLIRVASISIEGGDILNRRIVPPSGPFHVGGYQAAGTVEALGAAVTRFRVGDRVVGFGWSGSHAELFAVSQDHAFPVPAELDLDLAAVAPIAFGTASDALFEFGCLAAGETVLIQGAAGGVGLAAVQLAAQAGATVIATASSDERLAHLQEYGASLGINYLTEDIGQAALELTSGQGVDLVVDLAGGRSLQNLVFSLRHRGRFSVVGASSGSLPSFGFMEILSKCLTLHGIFFGLEMHTPRAHALIDDAFSALAEGRLRMPIAQTLSLRDTREAHRVVEQDHPFGRVIVKA